MRFYILTLFPDMIMGALSHSMLKRGMDAGAIAAAAIDIRDFAENKHAQVDDAPYGGGAGMVMMPGPVFRAVYHAKTLAGEDAPLLYMTPRGKPFAQPDARRLSAHSAVILLCGHYEGIDQRVIDLLRPEELSLGDFVLTGGELPALAVVDAVARLVPGVLGKAESFVDESFENGLLEYPHYTRPPEFMGMAVPEVLLSGHHANVNKWRLQQSISTTAARRPDLFAGYEQAKKGTKT